MSRRPSYKSLRAGTQAGSPVDQFNSEFAGTTEILEATAALQQVVTRVHGDGSKVLVRILDPQNKPTMSLKLGVDRPAQTQSLTAKADKAGPRSPADGPL